MKKAQRELIRDLERVGVTDYEFVHGGEHPRVYMTCRDGKRRFMVFSLSPSDVRAVNNRFRELCRIVGVPLKERRVIASQSRRAGKPLRRAATRRSRLECPTLTIKADPFEALAVLKAPASDDRRQIRPSADRFGPNLEARARALAERTVRASYLCDAAVMGAEVYGEPAIAHYIETRWRDYAELMASGAVDDDGRLRELNFSARGRK